MTSRPRIEALAATDLSIENESNRAFNLKVCIQYFSETELLTLVAFSSRVNDVQFRIHGSARLSIISL